MELEVVWKLSESKPIEPSVLSAPPLFPMPAPLWEMLCRRGYGTQDGLESLLNPSLKSLSEPYLLDQMEVAVNRLVQAYKTGEKVYIYADFDLDGTSGLALLHSALTDFGFKNLGYYQPKRLTEGYGFHVEAVEDIAKDGAALIVTVDVGIGAVSAAKKAKEMAVDLIITDHHLPKDEIPEALAVVNPIRGLVLRASGICRGLVSHFFWPLLLKKLRKVGGRSF